MSKKLVIFDMDGVLLDSEKLSDQCWKQTFKDHMLPFTDQERLSLVGMSIAKSRDMFLKKLSEDRFEELQAYSFDIFFKHVDEFGIDVKEGIFELIEELNKLNIKTAVASSTVSSKAIRLLKKADLYDRLDYHIFGDMVDHTKPDPEIFNRVVQHFMLDKEDALIFEDSYSGIKAANNAEVDVIWIEDMVDLRDKKGIYYLMSTTSVKKSSREIFTIINN
jgi:HAD superfamily hydrolase (TIGR01509 family)